MTEKRVRFDWLNKLIVLQALVSAAFLVQFRHSHPTFEIVFVASVLLLFAALAVLVFGKDTEIRR